MARAPPAREPRTSGEYVREPYGGSGSERLPPEDDGYRDDYRGCDRGREHRDGVESEYADSERGDDDYFALVPGESRTILGTFNALTVDSTGAPPVLVVESLNAALHGLAHA